MCRSGEGIRQCVEGNSDGVVVLAGIAKGRARSGGGGLKNGVIIEEKKSKQFSIINISLR